MYFLLQPGHRIARFSTINWGFCIPASCSADDLATSLTESFQTDLKETAVTFRVKVDPDLCYVKENLQGVSAGKKVTVWVSLWVYNCVLQCQPCLQGLKRWGDTLSVIEGKMVQNNLFFFLSLICFYPLIVGIEVYCCCWSHSVTYAHSHTHTFDKTIMGLQAYVA